MMLFVVGNQAGLEEFLNMQKLQANIAQASLYHDKSSYVIEDLHRINEDLCTDCEVMRGLYEPKHFAEAAHTEGTTRGQGFAPESEDIRDKVRLQTKKYDPNSMVHTEGSYQKDTNLTGSAVYGWKDGSEVQKDQAQQARPSPHHQQS